ncbi:class I SAM-dependent methyltransferase [Streptomonospora algeriensis]
MNADRTRATTDRRLLDSDDARLAAGNTLSDVQQPAYDLPALVAGSLSAAHRTVLDLGCGNGAYLHRLRSERPEAVTIGVDSELGALEDLPPPVLCASAAQLPIKAASVDAVLAVHTLHHLPDIDTALAEVVRVLDPNGILIASTSAEDDRRELDDLWQAAAADVLGTEQGPRRTRPSDHFPLEAGTARLREYFAEVTVQELAGSITVEDPAPVVEHLGSYRVWAAQTGVPFDETVHRARERLDAAIASAGAFTITTRQGIIRAEDPGGGD